MIQQPIRIELPTPFDIGTVNAWLFTEPEPVLVDCGQKTPDCIETLIEKLAENGLAIADLKKVVITHAHVDHAGLAGYLAEHSDAEFWVSDYAWDWVCDLERKWDERTDFMQQTLAKSGMGGEQIEKISGGMSRIFQIWDSVPVDRMVRFTTRNKLQMGGARWDVIYAPGHNCTQTCFYQPESQQLISADMLLHITPVPVIEPEPKPNASGQFDRILGLPTYLESAQTFYDLDVAAVYPGHGPIFSDPHRKVIDRQIGRIHKRKEQCLELVKDGHSTVLAITDVMYSHFPAGSRITGAAMVVGYLDLLMQEEKISRSETDGVWQFSI